MLTTALTLAMLANPGAKVQYGPAQPFGGETVRTWVRLDAKNQPEAIGITFSHKAMQGLPEKKPEIGEGYETKLTLPAAAKATPFDHVGVDWNPKGHTPIQIYGVPHFDFHFYAVATTELDKITAQGEDMARCQTKPAAEYIPEGYIYAPESEIPKMGSHWIDVNTPELHGGPFTSTFIYGSYNGKVTFIEPMISRKFMESKPNFVAAIKQPKTSPWSGKLVPTEYAVSFDEATKTYTVELRKFVKA